MKRTFAGCLVALMAISGSAYAQSSGTKEETKEAGSAAKDAGKAAAEAGKHAGKAATNASKKTAKTVKKTVTGDAHATPLVDFERGGRPLAAAIARAVAA